MTECTALARSRFLTLLAPGADILLRDRDPCEVSGARMTPAQEEILQEENLVRETFANDRETGRQV